MYDALAEPMKRLDSLIAEEGNEDSLISLLLLLQTRSQSVTVTRTSTHHTAPDIRSGG